MKILLCHFDFTGQLLGVRGRVAEVEVPLSILEVHCEWEFDVLVIGDLELVDGAEFLDHGVTVVVNCVSEIHKDFFGARVPNFLYVTKVAVHSDQVHLVKI